MHPYKTLSLSYSPTNTLTHSLTNDLTLRHSLTHSHLNILYTRTYPQSNYRTVLPSYIGMRAAWAMFVIMKVTPAVGIYN